MRNWWRKPRKWLGLLLRLHNPGDWLLFVRIFGFAAATPLLLRVRLPQLLAGLGPSCIPPAAAPARVQQIIHLVDAVLALGKPLVRPGCLTRGITLYYFLRRAGLDVALCFGMGQTQGKFIGHCWLEKDEEPFLERRDPRRLYAETYRFPGAASRERAALAGGDRSVVP